MEKKNQTLIIATIIVVVLIAVSVFIFTRENTDEPATNNQVDTTEGTEENGGDGQSLSSASSLLQEFASIESGNPATVKIFAYIEQETSLIDEIDPFFNKTTAPDMTFSRSGYTADYLSDKLTQLRIYEFYDGLIDDYNQSLLPFTQGWDYATDDEKKEAEQATARLRSALLETYTYG